MQTERVQSTQAPFTVLLVGSANVCRSALAERLGRAYLEKALGGTAIRLLSAGTQARLGATMDWDTAFVLQGYGAYPGSFRAQQLDADLAAQADLVLTMIGEQCSSVLEAASDAQERTFTLREAAALLGAVADDAVRGDEPVARGRELVRLLWEARAARQADQAADDVPDPLGRPIEVHEEAGELIAAALLPLLGQLAAVMGADAGAAGPA